MPSAFGHAFASVGLAVWRRKPFRSPRFWLFMILSAILPDIDFIAYKLGVSHESIFGHRGFTHSILFAVVWSGAISYSVFRRNAKTTWLFLFLATLSHGLLDACTNGGRGVGFFIPLDNTRYFFPFRPILVSPLDVGRFFTERGLSILRSEAFWIGIPTLMSVALQWLLVPKHASNR